MYLKIFIFFHMIQENSRLQTVSFGIHICSFDIHFPHTQYHLYILSVKGYLELALSHVSRIFNILSHQSFLNTLRDLEEIPYKSNFLPFTLFTFSLLTKVNLHRTEIHSAHTMTKRRREKWIIVLWEELICDKLDLSFCEVNF